MAGLSPKLPLALDPDDGYSLTKTMKEVAKQNFKMLILTNPGERIMDPDFGVGIMAYLFENNSPSTYTKIESRIREQATKYLPYIGLNSINFNSGDVPAGQAENLLSVTINYSISRLGVKDALEVPINL